MTAAAGAYGIDNKTSQSNTLPILLPELQTGLGNGRNRETLPYERVFFVVRIDASVDHERNR
jgi:hypothetical protein